MTHQLIWSRTEGHLCIVNDLIFMNKHNNLDQLHMICQEGKPSSQGSLLSVLWRVKMYIILRPLERLFLILNPWPLGRACFVNTITKWFYPANPGAMVNVTSLWPGGDGFKSGNCVPACGGKTAYILTLPITLQWWEPHALGLPLFYLLNHKMVLHM